MHLLKYRPSKIALTAHRNRQEIIKAGLGRRDLFKMGLLTGAGYLVAKHGLSTRVMGNPSWSAILTDCRPQARTVGSGFLLSRPICTTDTRRPKVMGTPATFSRSGSSTTSTTPTSWQESSRTTGPTATSTRR